MNTCAKHQPAVQTRQGLPPTFGWLKMEERANGAVVWERPDGVKVCIPSGRQVVERYGDARYGR